MKINTPLLHTKDYIASPLIRKKTTRDLPPRPLAHRAIKLQVFSALIWDYADTVCNLSAQMRISELKSTCRAVRELKTLYDDFRGKSLTAFDIKCETRLSLSFEELCSEHFRKLNSAIAEDEVITSVCAEQRYLIMAVQEAMTLIDAMTLYAADCDEWIKAYGVNARSIMTPHITKLGQLLPVFAGDAYNPKLEARKTTSRILYEEMKKIEVVDEHGNIQDF